MSDHEENSDVFDEGENMFGMTIKNNDDDDDSHIKDELDPLDLDEEEAGAFLEDDEEESY